MQKIILYFSILLCTSLCSCVSTGFTKRVDRDILEHQAKIKELEGELRNRDKAINDAIRELEDITKRSAGMEGTLDDVIELFDAYQRAVERFIQTYRSGETKSTSSI